MRKEKRAFPPAQPCCVSPPRAGCVIGPGCGAALGWMELCPPQCPEERLPVVPLRPGVGGSITVRGFRQPHQFQLRFLEAGTPPCDTPLLSPHLLGHCSKDSLPKLLPAPQGRRAQLHFRGALGGICAPHVPRQSVFVCVSAGHSGIPAASPLSLQLFPSEEGWLWAGICPQGKWQGGL